MSSDRRSGSFARQKDRVEEYPPSFVEGHAGDCWSFRTAEAEKLQHTKFCFVAETRSCWRHLLEMHWLQTVHSNLSSYTSLHNVDIKFIDIPTTAPTTKPEQQQPSPAATVFRLKDNTAMVHARLTDANTVLELRYLNWTDKPEAGKHFSSPRNLRLQIRLSATLLPVIRFSQDSESLWCYVLTTNNYLVRMRLSAESMFLTPLSGKFYSLQQLDNHIVPITFGIVSNSQVIVACENGSLIYLYDSSNGKRDKGDFRCARCEYCLSP